MRFDFVNAEKITSVPKWGTCALQLKKPNAWEWRQQCHAYFDMYDRMLGF